jgi:putative aminopeptidase FrvX
MKNSTGDNGMKSLIQKLVETTGPSGYESLIREVIQNEIKPEKGQVDALGNLIVRKGEKLAGGYRIMLAAHMDEIGLIASHIDENGFIRFNSIGGVYPRHLLGGRVRFMNGTEGVIGGDKLETTDKVHSLEHLYIDAGFENEKSSTVKVGDVAGFVRPYLDLGNRLVAKSMDDRIGVAILIEVLKKFKPSQHEVVFVFSTQEEVGLRGATTAAYGIDPDLGISVDVTLTGDTPKSSRMAVSLGKGPAIKVRDSGMISDPRVVRWMVETAEKGKIPFQREILEAGSTDARVMQITRAGVPSGCVSIPCRYVHSPSEMVDYRDVENSVKLILDLISKPIHLERP